MNDVAPLKERHHQTWAAGDYAVVARLIENVIPFRDPEAYASFFEANFGPTIKAKEALEPQGRRQELRGAIKDLVGGYLRDGYVEQEYFLITGRRSG